MATLNISDVHNNKSIIKLRLQCFFTKAMEDGIPQGFRRGSGGERESFGEKESGRVRE